MRCLENGNQTSQVSRKYTRKPNRSYLLQDSGKNSVFVHIKVNALNLTENMQVLPNLMKTQGGQKGAIFKHTLKMYILLY